MASQKDIEEKDKKLHEELEKTIQHQSRLLKEAQKFRQQFASQLLKLVTSGFGLVSALAWNELIKEIINRNVRPIFGEESGIVSLLVYATVVTFLAVLVTYQLSKLSENKD